MCRQSSQQTAECPLRNRSYFAFPNYDDSPAEPTKRVRDLLVANFVRTEFFYPEFLASLRDDGIRAPVRMPEASMNKHYRPEPGENDVRTPRQIFAMQPETQTVPVQKAANQQLWLRILSANRCHIPRPSRRYRRISLRCPWQLAPVVDAEPACIAPAPAPAAP